ncbi:glycerate kinase [Ambystoma mexicanum]|uniref:glycerate kinase n=1 Tax=Ambystoma mexicanum TaxID=8296 RepID=UPI0037E823A1
MAFALRNLDNIIQVSMKRTWKALLTHTKTSISSHYSMSLPEHGKQIFSRAVQAVLPDAIMRKNLNLTHGASPRLLVGGKEFSFEKLYIVGFGKAVLGMAATAEEILGDHLIQGIISIPLGIQECLRKAGKREMLLKSDSRIKVMEGARNNLPDDAALQAAREIHKLSQRLTKDDVLLVLISGGGSALLPSPIPPITLTEKQMVTRLLASRGATIQELNTVRKALSLLKGGGLARAAYPAQVVSLILSDVIGDPLDIIASGPTIPSPHSVRDCPLVLTKYNLWDDMPSSVQTVLQSDSGPSLENTLEFSHVSNTVIGSNSLALAEARNYAEELGYDPVVLSTGVGGDVGSISHFYSQLISRICSHLAGTEANPKADQELLELVAHLNIPGLSLADCFSVVKCLKDRRALCLLAGGETTVKLQGKGKGGRNQEMVLRVALELHKECDNLGPCDVLFLSGGTDGQDGPTEAAGAFCKPGLVGQAEQEHLDVQRFLRRNDSYTFFRRFKQGQNLLLTGLTGTNVMDVQVALIRSSESS